MVSAVVWDPAEGIAAAYCSLARVRDREHRATEDHPGECVFCPYPDAELGAMVEGFNRWAGFDERSGSYAEHEARRFFDLPRDEQRALVRAAQELSGRSWPPPIEAPDPAPAHVPTDVDGPPRPPWL